MPQAEPLSQPEPALEQFVPIEPVAEPITPAPVEPTQPPAQAEQAIPQDAAAEKQPQESDATKSPMDLLAKLLRGESARPDQS